MFKPANKLSRFEGHIDVLRAWACYDPDTGIVTRRKAGYGRKSGEIMGMVVGAGYVVLSFAGVKVYAHHVAWMLHFGEIPDQPVDHKNGVRSDNRIENLRLVSPSQSLMNTGIKSNNTSGAKGVHFDKGRQKWMAFIGANGIRTQLGRFTSFDDAVAARKAAEETHHGEYARQTLTSN
jgi:hypothetical protein